MTPFQNSSLRKAWLDCVEFMPDSELISYRDWLGAELDIAFDNFAEHEINADSYIDYVKLVRFELAFLNINSL